MKTYKTEGRYRVEVQADSSGTWAGNALRFDDIDSAAEYARDLFARWTLVTAWRVLDEDGTQVKGADWS